jgi:acetoin utilization deacetylase AcuC-like enzyme
LCEGDWLATLLKDAMPLFGPTWGEPPEGLRDRLALGLSRVGRALRDLGVPLRPPARLVYHPSYLNFPKESGGRHSFDVRRPARILEQLSRLGVLAKGQVLTPHKVERDDLLAVHTARYLDQLGDTEQLAKLLHLDRDQLVPGSEAGLLEPFLWQTGGTVLAAERAIIDRIPVVNLGGGFHHAQRDRADGFCPLNDLAVAVAVLRERGLAQRVLIVDLDYHQGDGTAQIFADDEDVFTLSLHGQTWVDLRGKQNHIDVQLPRPIDDRAYLQLVRNTLGEALDRFRPELALYVAGADPARGDRFGNLGVSEQALLTRDMHVARTLEASRVPMAVVLGGGYGALSWSIPFNFIYTLLTGTPPSERLRPSNIAARYQRVHQSLTPLELGQEDGELDDSELMAQLTGRDIGGGRVLGYYTRDGLALALERYGFLDLLREKGFDDFLFSLDTSASTRDIVRLHHRQRDPEHLLIEAALCIRPLYLPSGEECRMLRVEWLLMQDPTASFNLEQPPLPGQDYPGLGLFRWFGELLRLMAMRLQCDGLTNQPQHYHNGHLYGKVMTFFHPEDEGLLRALDRDLLGRDKLNLAEATRAVERGRVIDVETDEPLKWEVRAQVLPITLRLSSYFMSEEYRRVALEQRQRRRFRLLDDVTLVGAAL